MKNFYVIVLLLTLFSCNNIDKTQQLTKNEYKVGNIVEEQAFNQLTEIEKQTDSTDKEYKLTIPDSIIELKGQKINLKDIFPFTPNADNRSRFFFDSSINIVDENNNNWVEGLCTCELKNDTINISTMIGLFGGKGHNIKIHKSNFDVESILWIDDVKPFKANLLDTFSNSIKVKSKVQELIFKTRPKFTVGEPLFGKLNIISDNYYEDKGKKVDSSQNIKSTVLFKCQVRKYIDPKIFEE